MLKESGFVRELEDLEVAWRELVELGRARAAGAVGDGADPIDKLRRRGVFEQEVARARLECVVDVLV